MKNMKKQSPLLFIVLVALIFNSCSKEDTKQIDAPLEIKDNVLVKQITRTDEQGFVQTVDFKYEGNKIISIETEQEKIKFGYSGNLIIKKEVYNKTYANTETFNYAYNGKILSTMNTLSFIKYSGSDMMFKAPNTTTADGSEMDKYHGFVYFNQDNIFEYITIAENYDLLRDVLNPFVVDQNNYRYTYDEKKNPFDNIFGMGYLLNNDTEFYGILHLLNGTCKKNITKIESYSYLTIWGNPTSITQTGPTYIYERVYTYNELNYPTQINEIVYEKIASNINPIEIIKKDIVYQFYY
jgi:hypothetical protein